MRLQHALKSEAWLLAHTSWEGSPLHPGLGFQNTVLVRPPFNRHLPGCKDFLRAFAHISKFGSRRTRPQHILTDLLCQAGKGALSSPCPLLHPPWLCRMSSTEKCICSSSKQ